MVDLANSSPQREEAGDEGQKVTQSPNQSSLDCYYHQTVADSENQSQSANSISGKPETNLEIWTRITPQEEYVKLVIYHGRVIGALLIGDTELEEVCENLILNELDVRRYGMELLDPDIDIEDYFD